MWCPKGENPKFKRSSSFQVRFSINVLVGLIDDMLIGPVILPRTLTGESFLILLTNDLPELLEDVPLALRQTMYLQMRMNVRSLLNENYQNQWIGRQGPVGWPARSPAITPP